MTTVTEEVSKYREENGLTSLLDDSYVFANMKPDDFPQFVNQTIQLLSRNSGLHLRFGEDFTSSCFNPKTNTVTIPAPPAMPKGKGKTKASMAEFVKKLCQWRGVLNHEVGHAQFTIWRADSTASEEDKIYNLDYHKFVDLFENGRMERVACINYAGMHKDLVKLEDVLKNAIQKFHKDASKSGEWNDLNTLFYGIRMAVNGYEPAIAIPEHLTEDWNTCMDLVRESWETNEESESIEIAIKAHEFFKKKEEELGMKADDAQGEADKTKKKIKMKREDLEKMMQESEEGDQDDDQGEGQKVQINDPKAEQGEDGEPQEDDGGEPDLEIDIVEDDEEGEEENEDDNEEGDGEGQGEKKEEDKDSEEKDGEGDGEGDKEEDSEEKEDGEGEGDGEGEDEKEQLEKEIAELEKDLKEQEKEAEKAEKEAGKVDDLKDIDPTKEMAKEKNTEKTSRYSHSGNVVPLPLHDYVDVVEVVPADKSGSKMTGKILDDCLMKLSAMAQTFINKVRSSKHVGTRTYQGRVSTRSLYKYKHSRNIFKTELKRKKKDAAVSIVIDCSGSMEGYKIEAARKSALVIGEMMNRAKVEFELVGFTVPFREQFNYEPFTRHANLVHYRFGGSKDWNFRKHGVVEGRMARGLEDNDDGESLRHFADNLSKSKKERKMMIVISDGAPSACTQYGNTNEDLNKTIADIRKQNMEIYAIGIDTDAGSYYGKNNSVHLSSSATNVEIVEAISKFVNMIGSD